MLASGDHKRPWRMPTQSLLVVCSMPLERAATGVCASNLKNNLLAVLMCLLHCVAVVPIPFGRE